ncbi:hypothetical protein Areg01_63970 [Actinoplanes regularis]|nr:hypothetical protein Areg01_63970 [Actinoplanes regularis]
MYETGRFLLSLGLPTGRPIYQRRISTCQNWSIPRADAVAGWVFERYAKAVMWLALWLVEVGAKWAHSPPDDIDKVRAG